MKITFIIPFASLSGGHRVVATYARILQDRGHEVAIVSQPFGGFARDLRSRVKRLIGRGPNRPVEMSFDFLGDRYRVVDSPRPVTADDLPDADVVIATWWETAAWVAALPERKGRKFYLLQDYEIFGAPSPDPVIATYRLGLKMIAVSGYIRDVIETKHGFGGIEMVPNSVDLKQFRAPPRAKNTPIRAGFVYATSERKNVRLAIDVLIAVKARIPDIEALAFGSDMPIRDEPIPDWIRYVPNPAQAEIADLYASCDLWLFTSDHEGFGLPILEAMACRTPVLATRAGAAPDLIDGQNGTLLPNDAGAFVEEIVRHARMTDVEWRARSDAAHATVTGYDWDMATDRLLEHLRTE